MSTFNVRIIFNGLCIFETLGDSVRVHLVDARTARRSSDIRESIPLPSHKPFLRVPKTREGFKTYSLEGEYVTFKAPQRFKLELRGAGKCSREEPDTAEKAKWFCWVASLKRADPQAQRILDGRRICLVDIDSGKLGSHHLSEHIWEFEPVRPHAEEYKQVLAGAVELAFEELETDECVSLHLKKAGKEIQLCKSSAVACLNNLPNGMNPDPRGLIHFKWNYEALQIGGAPVDKFSIPRKKHSRSNACGVKGGEYCYLNDLTGSGVFCPPSSFP